ncbi:hypothetical protein [Paenibacillus sp. YN15]|uniref:hypothetical protein n=1 Tax=Paenibacillus sp. YN15 TaxID=1742774 RepID=UPI000DCB89FE|nr:hypothetical protein [Paenibacillus sp. YN15]RAU97098.1 hypothetical protein DQG13_19190 [Paenibacillus sp. YN15]
MKQRPPIAYANKRLPIREALVGIGAGAVSELSEAGHGLSLCGCAPRARRAPFDLYGPGRQATRTLVPLFSEKTAFFQLGGQKIRYENKNQRRRHPIGEIAHPVSAEFQKEAIFQK